MFRCKSEPPYSAWVSRPVADLTVGSGGAW